MIIQEAQKLLATFNLGVYHAEIDTTVGSIFWGAFISAKDLGYERGSIDFSMFVTGYVYHVGKAQPNGIVVDKFNRVLEGPSDER